MFVRNTYVPKTCSIGLLTDFQSAQDRYNELSSIDNLVSQSGTGLILVGFVVGNSHSDKVFQELVNKFPLLYKSEPRKNRNSGYMCYVCIFDCHVDDSSKYGFKDENAQQIALQEERVRARTQALEAARRTTSGASSLSV